MNLWVELFSHRGIAAATAMLLGAISLEAPALSLPASLLYSVLLITRMQPIPYMMMAGCLPWLLKCMLLGTWMIVPGLDFILLMLASAVYCVSSRWIIVLERISLFAFFCAFSLFFYKGLWMSLMEKGSLLNVPDHLLIGIIFVKVVLIVSLLVFFCARWVALLLQQTKLFDKGFKQSKVSMRYAMMTCMFSIIVASVYGAAGLALPLMMPFWYVGHVNALKWIKRRMPRSWVKPMPTVFYYLLLVMILLTDILMVLLVSTYMGLGVYQSFRTYWRNNS